MGAVKIDLIEDYSKPTFLYETNNDFIGVIFDTCASINIWEGL